MVPSLQQLLLHPQPGWWVVGLGSVHILCSAGPPLLPSTCPILLAPSPAPETPLQVFYATTLSVTTGSSPTWDPAD